MSHILFVEREAEKHKIADQLEFGEGKQLEHKLYLIIDSMIFIKEAIDGRLPEFSSLSQWKREMYAEEA